ncbi:MAG: hypothetical protein QOJ22_636 [Thermoleophilaceae bacterium]|jgi:hypothetical protein|nr:hypothetical protein [Thermoleophilaceae bacterium]
MSTLTARRDLQVKKLIKSGWLAIAVGLVVPFFALGAAFVGSEVSKAGEKTMGRALIVTGLAIFTLRLAFWRGWIG